MKRSSHPTKEQPFEPRRRCCEAERTHQQMGATPLESGDIRTAETAQIGTHPPFIYTQSIPWRSFHDSRVQRLLTLA